MIDSLRQVSERLAILKPVLALLGCVSLCLLIAEIFYELSKDHEDLWLTPAIVIFLWSLLGYLGLDLFRSVPGPATLEDSLWTRLKRRFSRGFYYSLAMLFLALTLVAVYLSYKLIGIYLS